MGIRLTVAMAAVLVAGAAFAAGGDAPPPSPAARDVQAEIAAHRAELDQITANMAVSQDRQAELAGQIAAIDKDRTSLNQALLDAGANVQQLEGQLDQSEAKLSAILTQEDQIRASLAGRRDVLSEVLAALQRMGDHPPPALLVRPEDALAAVESAILLGAIVPNLRAAADQLAGDLARLKTLEAAQAAERDRLKANDQSLLEQRARIGILLDDKARQLGTDTTALASEQQASVTMAARASDLNGLLATAAAAPPPSLTGSAGAAPAPLPPGAPKPRSLGSAGRLAPSVAFVDAKGLLPLPVNGRIVTGFGEVNSVGEKAQGISLATRPGAAVLSPADGTVEFAGQFRSYGQLLIINAGGGYHIVLAGMDRIDVQPSQFVLAGEPVAAMASQRLASTGATLVGTTEPVLYVEFRKADGASIDPAPWWAASNPEKVGG